MRVKYFVQLLTFFSALVPYGLNCSESCSSITLNIRLGSEVLLPCGLLKSRKTEEARWSQTSSLLSIRSPGNVTFEDPRDGRLTAFPFLFDRGNFSILIHQFQASDVGIYCCRLSRECQRVEIKLHHDPDQDKVITESLNFPWYYIAAGVGIFILLVTVFSLIYKFRGKCLKSASDSYYVNQEQREAEHRDRVERTMVDECDGEYEDIESDTHGADYENAPGEEFSGQDEDTMREEQDEDYVNTERRSGHDQYYDTDRKYPAEHHVERDMQGYHDNDVYENDEHNPNQKSKFPPKGFRKMPNQQPSSEGLYYANQSQIDKSRCARNRNKDKAEYQFKNPLYDQTPANNK